jgi:signal recognition particle subunit SRP54
MANPDKQKAMAKKLEEGKFALRDWREQLTTLMSMWVRFGSDDSQSHWNGWAWRLMGTYNRGSMSKIMSSIPGLSGAMEGMSDEDTGAKLKRMIYIMDSMRTDELDSDGLIFVSFCSR